MNDIAKAMSATSYPGRGILVGLSKDGQRAVMAYFIMGRSENSRNRVFVSDGGGIRTHAFDAAKMKDPSLVIYVPVRVLGDVTIVTNGDQTDTIFDGLKEGVAPMESLRTRRFEPDAPNYTPRISAVVDTADGHLRYQLSILKTDDGESCQRFFYQYDEPQPGLAHFIHTYSGDGDPLPSFSGEPEPVALLGPIDNIAKGIWENLDADNKVSLFVRTVDLSTGQADTRIINKHAG